MKIKTIVSIILCLSILGCLEGPTGPQGEKGEKGEPGVQGEKGENAEINIISGTLLAGDIVDNNYWLIETGSLPEDWLVIVYVRAGQEKPWFEPEWDILTDEEGITTVAIYEGETVAGYEYRVVILN